MPPQPLPSEHNQGWVRKASQVRGENVFVTVTHFIACDGEDSELRLKAPMSPQLSHSVSV